MKYIKQGDHYEITEDWAYSLGKYRLVVKKGTDTDFATGVKWLGLRPDDERWRESALIHDWCRGMRPPHTIYINDEPQKCGFFIALKLANSAFQGNALHQLFFNLGMLAWEAIRPLKMRIKRCQAKH